MTPFQTECLLDGLLEAAKRCNPDWREYEPTMLAGGYDSLRYTLDSVASGLGLPATGPLLSPREMPWRAVQLALLKAAFEARTWTSGGTCRDDVASAITIATGGAQ